VEVVSLRVEVASLRVEVASLRVEVDCLRTKVDIQRVVDESGKNTGFAEDLVRNNTGFCGLH
jgi:GTP cyclohydrolase FolE2